jgi:purine-binding chemotaxis protein CheW
VTGQGAVATTAETEKYLTFKLGPEEYGVDILKVKEIIGMLPITMVPRTPEAVRGVVNLRGKIIPVLDLGTKFGMGKVEDTEVTCIVVVDADPRHTGTPVLMGLIVDSVSEVVDIPADEVEDASCFGMALDTTFIVGLAKHRSTVKILLNIEAVLAEPGVLELAATAQELALAGASDDEEG